MGKYRNLLVNIVLFALNSAATKFISFFLVPLYTAYMSAGEYGVTDMANSVISLVFPLVTLDISEAAVRFIVEDKINKDRYAAVSFIVTLLSVVAVALVTPVFDLGVFGGLGVFKGWFVIDYATSAFMTLCGGITRGIGSIRLIPFCSGVSSVVTLACAVVFIATMDMGIVGYFASVSVGPALAVAIYLSVGGIGSMVVRGGRDFIHGGLSLLKCVATPMFRYSLPLIPNSLFWWMGTSINRLFITGMLGISASGLFAAAGKIPSLLNTAYGVFQQAWQLSAFQESKRDGIAAFYSTVFRAISAGLITLCALLSFFVMPLAELLLKGETFEAWPMISILLLANLMNVFNSFYGTVYTATMHTEYVMRTTVFGALSCVIFTPLLIPSMGVYGACIASVAGQGIVFVMRARDSKRYIDFQVGWKLLLLSIAILIVQSFVTALRLSAWRYVSFVCAAIVILIQIFRLMPLLKSLTLMKHKKEFRASRESNSDFER